MKTIFSILLLPIMVFSQPLGQDQKAGLNTTFYMDLSMESVLQTDFDLLENLDVSIALCVTITIDTGYLEATHSMPYFIDNKVVENKPPQYLSSISIAGLHVTPQPKSVGQDRLDLLLALNDPQFPKEDTLLDWLHPVRYLENSFGGAATISEGFGPRIKI